MPELLYRPPATLKRFLRNDAFVRAVVGPVGSGKSSACCVEIARRAAQQQPEHDGVRRSRWAIIRNTYGELRDTTRKTFEQWIPATAGRWREQEFTFEINGKLRDGTAVEAEVMFRALDRPEDVKKLLSLELTGAYINEAREVPKHVLDVLQTRVGRYPSMRDGGPTWFGVWMDTNPWAVGSWGYKLFSQERPEGFEVFEQPGGRSPNAENVENLVPGYYQRLVAGKDSEWVSEYVDGEYPLADKGSIFGKFVAELELRGGLKPFEHPRDGIFTNFDLGVSDSTAIWFWRLGPLGVDIVDHYEAHGQALSHFFRVLRDRKYSYVKHWLPHDARARTLATGRSIQDEFISELGGDKVAIGPPLSVKDGIGAARKLLEHAGTRIHPRCAKVDGPTDIDGVDALREYRYKYDEVNKVYSRQPLHNWASHTGDAFRYVGCVVKVSELLSRIEAPKKPARVVHAEALTLGDPEDDEHGQGSRRI